MYGTNRLQLDLQGSLSLDLCRVGGWGCIRRGNVDRELATCHRELRRDSYLGVNRVCDVDATSQNLRQPSANGFETHHVL